jgi:murein DD-endopeptidase MepM/ murein hydrolase activator NlpD
VIGYVGSSDPALGPHLHFELRPQGRPIDPLDILKARP